MRKHSTTTLYREERKWFFAALTLLLFVASLYIYFLSASVVHVVIRKELNQEISSISSYVSQLEAEYIEAQHKVSNELASMHGYTITEEKIFIDRTQSSLVLGSFNEI